MIAQEAKQQSLRDAKAIRDKAQLDLRTADVRSEIEAEILEAASNGGDGITDVADQRRLLLAEGDPHLHDPYARVTRHGRRAAR